MAAVDLAHEVLESLSQAFAASPLTAAQVAKELGVSEGRISQIRNGDGNLRISTLAKILTILGGRAQIKVRADGPRVRRPLPRRKQQWHQLFVDETGVRVHTYEGPQFGESRSMQPLGPPSHVGWRQMGHSQSTNPWDIVMSEFLDAKQHEARDDDDLLIKKSRA